MMAGSWLGEIQCVLFCKRYFVNIGIGALYGYSLEYVFRLEASTYTSLIEPADKEGFLKWNNGLFCGFSLSAPKPCGSKRYSIKAAVVSC